MPYDAALLLSGCLFSWSIMAIVRRLLCVWALACTNTAALAALPWNYLYEIRDTSGVAGYLFGSAHAGINELSGELSACVAGRLTGAKKVVMETNVFEAAIRPYGGAGRITLAELAKDLSEEEKALLSRFALNGQPIERVSASPALMVFFALEAAFQARGGMKAGVSADFRVMAAAMTAGLPLAALESVDEQYAAMDALPREALLALMQQRLKVLSNEAQVRQEARDFRSFMEAVLQGDEDRMLRIRTKQLSIYERFDQVVIYERNKAQATHIAATLKARNAGPVFFAIGAQHLPGPAGVATRLAAEGFSVQQVCGGPVRQ